MSDRSFIASGSYAEDVGMEPLGEDEQAREVEGHHEPKSRADTGLVVDQPPSACIGTIIQRWTAKPLVASKLRGRKLLQCSWNGPRQLVALNTERF